jgi:hypothetical protein
MIKNILHRNTYEYALNFGLFCLLIMFKPGWAAYAESFLILILVLSFIFIKPIPTDKNIWKTSYFQVINQKSLYLLISILPFLSYWEDFSIVEQVYMVVFPMIQLASIKINIGTEKESINYPNGTWKIKKIGKLITKSESRLEAKTFRSGVVRNRS